MYNLMPEIFDFSSVKCFSKKQINEHYILYVGLSMRGWVNLSIDSIDNKLHIIGSDLHDKGAVWLSYPILTMDVYEHAYFMDFGTDRIKYISAFIENINWRILNDRYQNYISSTQLTNINQQRYCPYNYF